MSATPRVTIVTILYRSDESFSGFLRFLQAQDFEDWTLFVIDNNPEGDAAAATLIQSDPRARLIQNASNIGFARAANQGLRAGLEIGSEFLVLFNNDVRFGPTFLRELIEVRGRLDADVVAPRIMEMDQPDRAWYAGGHFHYGWIFNNIHETDYSASETGSRVVDFASGCCLGLTSRVLQRVGFLNESYFVYWEDVDYCLRLKAAGVPVHYTVNPSLEHVGGASSGDLWSVSHINLYYCSFMQLMRLHFGWLRAVWTAVLLVVREAKLRDKGVRQFAAMVTAIARGLVAPTVPTRLAQPRLEDVVLTPLHRRSGGPTSATAARRPGLSGHK